MSKYDDLMKLKELHDAGAINDEEYEAERKKMLDAPEKAEPQQQPSVTRPAVAQPQVVINNSNTNMNQNFVGAGMPRPKNKWVALLLCIFLGYFGAHKFYEGKILLGIVYIFTGGLFFIGIIVDFFSLLFKPNPYYI